MPRRRNNKSNRATVGRSELPPPYMSSLMLRNQRFRYRSPGTTTFSISNRDFTQLIAVPVAASTTVATSAFKTLIKSARIKSIDVWGCGASGEFNTMSLQWTKETDSNGAAGFITTVTGYGNVVPMHLHSVPPRFSHASFWLDNSDTETTLIQILNETSAADILVDVVVDLVLTNDSNTVTAIESLGYATSAVASVDGLITYLPLNGVEATSIADALVADTGRIQDLNACVSSPAS